MPIYMKFEGAKPAVPGTVKDSGHANWVEVDSLQIPGAGPQFGGMGGGRGASGSPKIQEIAFTMPMNASAQALWSNAGNGSVMKVLVDFLGSGGKPADVYLSLTLTEAMIVSFSVSGEGSGSGRSAASASISFTQMTWDVKGKAATAP